MRVNNWNVISYSIAVTTALFVLLLALCAPIINSDDNFFILYTLAGGYGLPPTHLLHYFYEWHPFFFWPIAKMFSLFPHFNWYTGFLLLLQFIGCAHLLYGFQQMFNRGKATILFLLFFLFFESVYLLSLNHSNTSFLLAISGCSSLLYYFKYRDLSTLADLKKLIFPFCLLLVSGLLRVPTFGLYVLLSVGMGWVILPFPRFKKMILAFVFVGVFLLFSMAAHRLYYIAKNPNYEREEQFRQSLFYLANHPTTPPQGDTGITTVKNSFIQSWFLYDTSFVGLKDINAYTQKTVQSRLRHTGENRRILYWTFINSRVYLLLLGIILSGFITFEDYKGARQWLLMCLPGILSYTYLVLFMKVTEGIFMAILSSFFLSAVFCFGIEKIKKTSLTPVLLLLLLLNTAWMLLRIKKTSDINRSVMSETRALLKEISAHPRYLFVNSDKKFRDGGFYIWDTPQQYPLKNLINKELLITNSYNEVLRRFEIKDLMTELPGRDDILLFDQADLLLQEYYRVQQGMEVETVAVDGFKTIQAYRLRKKM